MTESSHKFHQRSQRDKDQDHRHVKLWVLVGLSMAVIVTIWAILLPTQLRSLQTVNSDEIRRWQVIKEENGAVSFQEAFGELRGRLRKLDEGFGGEAVVEEAQADIEEGEVAQSDRHLPLTGQENTIEHAFELLKARLESNASE